MSDAPDPELSAWATAPEMSAWEAMMWRAEADPMLRSAGVILELLDTTPDWERFVDGHAWATRRVPRLRHRVVDDPTLIGPPAWVESEVDLEHHVRHVQLPQGGDIDDVLRIAQTMHTRDFDRSRPLWEAVLVEGLPDGRAVYLLKIHHAMADGPAVIQLFDLLHSAQREPTADKPELPPMEALETGSLELSARHAAGAITGSVGTAARLAKDAAVTSARAVRDPAGAIDYAKSVRRVTADVPATPSPVFGTPGLARHVDTIDVDLEQLKRAGKAAGGTLNDAYVAGLLGGLERYHELHGVEVADLPIALPVSLRVDQAAASEEGNRFAAARIAAPAGPMEVPERIELVGERIRRARYEAALDFLGLTSELISRIPVAILTRMMRAMTGAIDMQASNFLGLRRDAYLAGARVERWYVFGPAPGCAIMSTLVSHGDSCCIGVTLDADQVRDPEALIACLRDGFAEVVGSVDPAAAA